jgi:ketosteroid isomerase-like protein
LTSGRVIRALEVETLEASLHGDFTALERLWADDFEFTAPNGLTIPKAAYIDMLKSGAVKYERLELESESLQVRVFGESATASGRFRVKGQANGHVLDGIDQSLTVYVRRDGTWRQVATLLTRVTTFGRS